MASSPRRGSITGCSEVNHGSDDAPAPLASSPPAALETHRRRADALFPDSRLVPGYDGDLLVLREFFRHSLGVYKFMARLVTRIEPGDECLRLREIPLGENK